MRMKKGVPSDRYMMPILFAAEMVLLAITGLALLCAASS